MSGIKATYCPFVFRSANMSDIAKIVKITSAIREMLEIFAEQEIGYDVEIDDDALASYIDSNKGFADYFLANTKEEIYDVFLKQILNGYPVWQLLKLSDWTKNMLQREFQKEIDEEEQEMKKRYACLTCKYYSYTETSLGRLPKCHGESWIKDEFGFRKERVKLRKQCKRYEKLEGE